MPIKLSKELPAYQKLSDENIFVMDDFRASTQDIRPLKIALLNLMPTKIATETQITRLISNTPLQIELDLVRVESHVAKNTSEEHLTKFYVTFDQIKDNYYDGFIITGAPVEHMPFEEVDYWDELCEIMEWTKTHVQSTFHICWGAQAGLYYHYGIPKYHLDKKMFGIFPHKVVRKSSILMRGFDDVIMAPHSRHTTIKLEDIEKRPELKVLSVSDEAGVYAVATEGGRQVFITGHSEYEPNTLNLEYQRDKNLGLPIEKPKNYFPNDDDTQEPICLWRAHANLLYSNWLNYFVYQVTPYDIKNIK